jgi:hypothetical protein
LVIFDVEGEGGGKANVEGEDWIDDCRVMIGDF